MKASAMRAWRSRRNPSPNPKGILAAEIKFCKDTADFLLVWFYIDITLIVAATIFAILADLNVLSFILIAFLFGLLATTLSLVLNVTFSTECLHWKECLKIIRQQYH